MDLYLETDSFKVKVFQKGEVIFSKDARADNLYILKRGTVVCFLLSPNKRVIPVQSYVKTGIFGEDGVLSADKKYAYYAIALEECSCTMVPRAQVKDVLDASSGWVGNLLENISSRVNQTVEVLAEHRIIDERLNLGTELSQKDEKLILNALKG